MSVEANDRDEAVSKMKAMMTDEAIAAHFSEMHKGEAVLPKSVVDMGIAKDLQLA